MEEGSSRKSGKSLRILIFLTLFIFSFRILIYFVYVLYHFSAIISSQFQQRDKKNGTLNFAVNNNSENKIFLPGQDYSFGNKKNFLHEWLIHSFSMSYSILKKLLTSKEEMFCHYLMVWHILVSRVIILYKTGRGLGQLKIADAS